MTDEPYLILHKVRGEPAFDIATKIMIGDEEGWIIPTSGHRAYPGTMVPLTNVSYQWVQAAQEDVGSADWDALPDHYDAKRDDGAHLVNAARDILLRKGLIKPSKPAQPHFRRV